MDVTQCLLIRPTDATTHQDLAKRRVHLKPNIENLSSIFFIVWFKFLRERENKNAKRDEKTKLNYCYQEEPQVSCSPNNNKSPVFFLFLLQYPVSIVSIISRKSYPVAEIDPLVINDIHLGRGPWNDTWAFFICKDQHESGIIMR